MWQHRGMRLHFPGQSHLHDRQRHEFRSRHLVHPSGHSFRSVVGAAASPSTQTIPALLLPFTGVLIDREDRRHLMMWLDSLRGVSHPSGAGVYPPRAVVAALTPWVLVADGFWMFFPTDTRSSEELTPDDKMLDSNALFLAALQGGWLLAGAVVGFVYNRIGLGGVLLTTPPATRSPLLVFSRAQGTSDRLSPAPPSNKEDRPDACGGTHDSHELRKDIAS